MAVTYDKIATNTLGSATSTVTFSSISSSYTDLVVIIEGTGSTSSLTAQIYFNSDNAATLYSHTNLYGNGTSALSSRTVSADGYLAIIGNVYSTQTNFICNIQNYSNSTTFKTVLARENNAANQTVASVALWRNTNAITSVSLNARGGNWLTGTTFNLYGIKAA